MLLLIQITQRIFTVTVSPVSIRVILKNILTMAITLVIIDSNALDMNAWRLPEEHPFVSTK